jgi:hypothetical protein
LPKQREGCIVTNADLEVIKMGSWSHIILEGYCTYQWASKKEHKCYSFNTKTRRFGRKEIVMPNKAYIPKTKRPVWCRSKNKKRLPCYKCLAKGCPFLAYCDASKMEYAKFFKIFENDKVQIL